MIFKIISIIFAYLNLKKAIINLQSFDFSDKYASFNNSIQAINTFTFSQGYAIVKKKIKINK